MTNRVSYVVSMGTAMNEHIDPVGASDCDCAPGLTDVR